MEKQHSEWKKTPAAKVTAEAEKQKKKKKKMKRKRSTIL